MSQQQQSEQPPQQPKQTNWLVVMVVTAVVGGIVQVLVNHFDGIAATVVGLFSQIHVPALQGTPTFVVLNTLSGIATILSGGAAIISFWLIHKRKKRERLMMEHLILLAKGTERVKKSTKQTKEYAQQMREGLQKMKEGTQQLQELLEEKQWNKGSSTSGE